MEPTPEPDDPWQARGQARSWPAPGRPAPGPRRPGEDGDPAHPAEPAEQSDQLAGAAGPTGGHPQVSDDKSQQQRHEPDLFAPGRVNAALTSDTEMVALGSRRPADALLGGGTRWANQAPFPPETNGHRNGDAGPRHGGAPIMNAPRSPFTPPGEDPPPSSPLFAPSPFAPQSHGPAPTGNPPTIEPPPGSPAAAPNQQPSPSLPSPQSPDRSGQAPSIFDRPAQQPLSADRSGQPPTSPQQPAPLSAQQPQSPLSSQAPHSGQAQQSALSPQSPLSPQAAQSALPPQSPLSPDRSGQPPTSPDRSGQSLLSPQSPLSPDRSGPDRSGQPLSPQAPRSPERPGQPLSPQSPLAPERPGQPLSPQSPLDGRAGGVQPVSGSAQVPVPMPARAAAALQASAAQAAAASAQTAPGHAPARPVSAQPAAPTQPTAPQAATRQPSTSQPPVAPQQEVNRPVPHALSNDAATPTRLEPTGWATNPRAAASGSAAVPVSPSGRRSRDDDAQDDNRTPAPRRASALEDDLDAPAARRASRANDEDDAPLRPGDVNERSITFWEEAASEQFRAEWHEVKAQFVDDPVAALTRAHDLLTEAVNELTESMLAERDDLDPLRGTSTPDTESMRMAMRGYREFLDRILAL